MDKKSVSNMITDVTKRFKKCSVFDLAIHLIDTYYLNLYNGSEHEKVSLMYFDYVFIELTLWLGQNMERLKQDKKTIKFVDNFFKKEILKGKIKSYPIRLNIYHKWLGGELHKDDPCDMQQYLFKIYKNLNECKEVKKELGLNETILELRIKLKEIK